MILKPKVTFDENVATEPTSIPEATIQSPFINVFTPSLPTVNVPATETFPPILTIEAAETPPLNVVAPFRFETPSTTNVDKLSTTSTTPEPVLYTRFVLPA